MVRRRRYVLLTCVLAMLMNYPRITHVGRNGEANLEHVAILVRPYEHNQISMPLFINFFMELFIFGYSCMEKMKSKKKKKDVMHIVAMFRNGGNGARIRGTGVGSRWLSKPGNVRGIHLWIDPVWSGTRSHLIRYGESGTILWDEGRNPSNGSSYREWKHNFIDYHACWTLESLEWGVYLGEQGVVLGDEKKLRPCVINQLLGI
jgi:hypothetical protein